MSFYHTLLQSLKEEGVYRTLPDLEIRGKKVYIQNLGKELINANSNDYLGLLDAPEYREAFLDSDEARHLSLSSASSRLLTGNDSVYSAFEAFLSTLYSVPSALIWGSGYHANSGIIPVLALRENSFFIADRFIHASMVEGLKLARCPFTRYKHNDIEELRRILAENADKYSVIWVLTESVFSMDGDIAPLAEIVALKKEYPNLCIYLDEAHAVGVYGGGLGLAWELGVIPDIDIFIGTLGKAMGSLGAYSLQSETLRSLFISSARPFIYSTALPPFNIAWSHFIFQKVLQMQERRAYLWERIHQLASHLELPARSPIFSIILPHCITEASDLLRERGFYTRPIRKPTVPSGTERLRISLTAAFTPEEVEILSNTLRLCKERF